MRIVKEIPHERFKIQIMHYNEKYMLKIELGQFEQVFKIGQMDIENLEDLESMMSDEFLSSCIHRFISMRTDWEKAFLSVKEIKNK